jgi:hypothetical protein
MSSKTMLLMRILIKYHKTTKNNHTPSPHPNIMLRLSVVVAPLARANAYDGEHYPAHPLGIQRDELVNGHQVQGDALETLQTGDA